MRVIIFAGTKFFSNPLKAVPSNNSHLKVPEYQLREVSARALTTGTR